MWVCQAHATTHRSWLTASPARRPAKVAAIALAIKTRPNGLGHDGQGRAVQESGRVGGLTVKPGNDER